MKMLAIGEDLPRPPENASIVKLGGAKINVHLRIEFSGKI
jgi:hypothetical protein